MPPATSSELRDGRRRSWFWAHNAIWDVPDLSAHAILVYLYLCRCADAGGTCWPSRSTIARACRISKDTVDRAIKQLCEKGLLIKEVRQGPDGAYSSNLYTILDPPVPDASPQHPRSRSERPPLAAGSGYPWPQRAAILADHSGHRGRTERHEGQPIEGLHNKQHHLAPGLKAVGRDDDVSSATGTSKIAEHEAAFTMDHQPPLDPAAMLAQAYRQVTGRTLTEGEARQIVERYGLAYALEKLELVAWQKDHGGFERGPKAYYLAALKGDWRVESYIPERVRKLQEAQRRQQEEALRREEERKRFDAEKRLAAALDAVIATLPADERIRLEAEAEARVRQRTSDKLRAISPVHRLLVQVEMRALVRQRYADRLHGVEAGA